MRSYLDEYMPAIDPQVAAEALQEAEARPKGDWPAYKRWQTKRVGLIAMKCGMTQVWDSWGRKRVCTVLQVDDCAVTQVKRAEDNADGRKVHTVQVGGGLVKAKAVNKPLLGHFRKADVAPKRSLAEFQVSEDALPPVGAELTARHFRCGQRVDIQGTSKGKMFAGVMKRWNFKGGPASHGSTKFHRKPGSIGQCQTPGRVWKGKKMAGRMGNKTRSVLGLPIYQIDVERNLIFVEGHVPGNVGGILRIRDTKLEKKYPFEDDNLPPVPTHFASWDEQQEEGMEANVGSAVINRHDGETLLVARQPDTDPNDLAAAYEAAGMKKF